MMGPEAERLAHLLTGFFLAKQAEGCSPKTIAEYQTDFAHFARWCRAQGKTDPATLGPADLRAFLAHLRTEPNGRGRPLAAKTVYNCWAALRSFYRWLSEEERCPNPMASVPAPKASQPVIEPLSREEVVAILTACESTRAASTKGRAAFAMRRDTALRDRAIVLVLLDAGLRASELCHLTVDDVDLATGRVLVRCGKGGKGRVVYLGKMARRAVWKYLAGRKPAPDEPPFLTREGRPVGAQRELDDEAAVPHAGRAAADP